MRRTSKSPEEQRGFQRGPGLFEALITALVLGALAWAAYKLGASWWQKALLVPGLLLTYLAALLVAGLLFGGVMWLCFSYARLRKTGQLRRFLELADGGDYAGADALSNIVCTSGSRDYRDGLARSPELCTRLVELSRRGGRARLPALRIVMRHAPHDARTESAVLDGRDAIGADELWPWLNWFLLGRPDRGAEASVRRAAALEHGLTLLGDRQRRAAWKAYLPYTESSDAWRRLAGRYRADLLALADDPVLKTSADQRRTLDTLLAASVPADGRAPGQRG